MVSFLYLAFNFVLAIITTALPWDGCLDEVVFAFLPDDKKWDRSWLLLENRITHPVVTAFQFPDGRRGFRDGESRDVREEKEKELQELIKNEDGLSQSRLSWFVTSQAFLFGAAATIATAQEELSRFRRLVTFVPLIGLLSSIFTRFDTMGCTLYRRALFRSQSWMVAKIEGTDRYHTIGRPGAGVTNLMQNAVIYTAFVAWAILLSERDLI